MAVVETHELRRVYKSSTGVIRRGVKTTEAVRGINLAIEQGDYPAAQTCFEESLGLFRELGDRRGAAGLLGNLSLVAYERNDLVSAGKLAEESRALATEVADQGRIADALSILGNVASEQGDFATASALNEQSLAIGRELGEYGLQNYTEVKTVTVQI